MRKPKALSPTSLRLWGEDRELLYMQSLAEVRAPRGKQGQPAAAGSAFDAFVKSALHADLGGKDFTCDDLLHKQVDAEHRDWGREHGKYLLDCYKASCAYSELLTVLRQSEDVSFEFSAQREVDGVPFTGYPDLAFRLTERWFVLDWKVRGYMSTASPSKCYVKIADSWVGKQSRSNGKAHTDCLLETWNGLRTHGGSLEDSDPKYADQLAIYSWLVGQPVCNDSLFWIEELCAKRNGDKPLIRVATHRAKISCEYQSNLLAVAKQCWAAIQSGHIFDSLAEEQSKARCSVLDTVAQHLNFEDANYVCAV